MFSCRNIVLNLPLLSCNPCLPALVATVVLLTGCGNQEASRPVGSPVLARVGNAEITVDQFNQELTRRARLSPGQYDTPARRESVLEELLRFEVLFARAQAAGYDQRAELRERFRRLVVAKFEEDQEAAQPPVAFKPSAAEVEAAYQKRLSEFSQPEKVRMAVIYVRASAKASPEKQQEIRQRAEQIRNQAVDSSATQISFGDLARQHSEHQATRYQGGDAGLLTDAQVAAAWPPEVYRAVKTLKNPGDIGPVVANSQGFYLVKLMERTAASSKTLTEVRDRLEYELQHQKSKQRQADLYAKLKNGLNIQINREALAAIPAPPMSIAARSSVPPPVPHP